MTTGAFGRLTRLALIFDALRGERFIRGPLLRELIEIASESPDLSEVCLAATRLLGALEDGIDDREYDRRVQSIGAALRADMSVPAEKPAPRLAAAHGG